MPHARQEIDEARGGSDMHRKGQGGASARPRGRGRGRLITEPAAAAASGARRAPSAGAQTRSRPEPWPRSVTEGRFARGATVPSAEATPASARPSPRGSTLL